MQVFKAWSSSHGVCEPPADVVTPPVTITVRPRPAPRPAKVPAKPPSAPCPLAPEERRVAAKPVEAASALATAHWLRQAVALAVVGRELGSEGLATVLAARMDEPMAQALRGLRDRGELAAGVGEALMAQGLESREDVPLERILRSAMRRFELREWLPIRNRLAG